MMRYVPAIFVSFVLWMAIITVYFYSQGKAIQPLQLIGGWTVWTFVLSLPVNALSNYIRRRLHWRPLALLFITPPIALTVFVFYFSLIAAVTSQSFSLERRIHRSMIVCLGTLPLTISLIVTCRRTPLG